MAPLTSHRVDAELGGWTFTEWRPGTDHPLSWAVDRIWDFDGRVAIRRERVFPDGQLELIVQLDDRYHDVHGDRLEPTPVTCLTGIQTAPLVIEAPPKPCRVLGIRLRPAGAWAVLQQPLSPLTGRTTNLKDVVGAAAMELAEQCQDAHGASDRVLRAREWVRGRLERSSLVPRLDPAVQWIAARIARARGRVRIDDLRAEAGVSANRLASTFLAQVGVTPKRYARIHRFRGALEMLHRSPQSSLSEVAQRAGYYDHPHMNADFRELAGLTPSEFLASRRYPASVSLAEES